MSNPKEKGSVKQRKVKKTNSKETTEEKPKEPKYGPMPTFPKQRFWTRLMLILGTLVVVYFTSNNDKIVYLAKQKEHLMSRRHNVDCSPEYLKEIDNYQECRPERCGRFVMDGIVTGEEASRLKSIAERGLAMGGSDGGASVLDLHSGALSYHDHFINIYKLPNVSEIFSKEDFKLYKTVRTKVQHAVAHNFGVPSTAIYLTHPTFFSKLTNLPPVTQHDEYWHPHVDKETYKSFHYTSLIYLNDYSIDFNGGRFFFDDKNTSVIVEPKQGRLSMFTSGHENVHHVERVVSGTRYAMTVSFTCDQKSAVSDPQ